MLDRRLLIVVAGSMLLAACSATAPGASPTAEPPDTSTPTPTVTATVTATPTDAAAASPTARETFDDYSYGDDYNYGSTPPPATPAPTDQAETSVSVITYGELGSYLAGPTQMALYTFDRDEPGESACTGDCVGSWPPLTIEAGATPAGGPGLPGELGTIERADGTFQVTYDGAPLYYFVGDEQLYDVTGDGVGGVWHLARP